MKQPFRLALAIAVALSVGSVVRAQDAKSKIEQYMDATAKVDHFMGAVLVAQHGTVLFSAGYGLANVKVGIRNAPKTEFQVASITKEFTAMAVLELQERGKLNVQNPVCKYVPSCPKDWAPITIFNLLTHTSGIPDFTTFPVYSKVETQPETPRELLALFENRPLVFTPGIKYAYSNSGYILLGYIVQRVSGEAYPEFLAKNIFTPLGMRHTGYDGGHPSGSNRARGYFYSKGRYVPAAYVNMTALFSAGGLYSTVLDLYKWERAVHDGKLISGRLRDEMIAPQVSMDSSGEFHSGFGWVIQTKFGHKEVSHSGGVQGFTSRNVWFPDDDAYIIVLDNMTLPPPRVGDIGDALAAILFNKEYAIPKS